ncbi:hypothetical protein D3C72_604870 [compost metagenome]
MLILYIRVIDQTGIFDRIGYFHDVIFQQCELTDRLFQRHLMIFSAYFCFIPLSLVIYKGNDRYRCVTDNSDQLGQVIIKGFRRCVYDTIGQ